METLRACVVGATGYAGVELVRLLLGHPNFELAMATDRKLAGTKLSEVYPALIGVTDIELSYPEPAEVAKRADVAFLAVPQTTSLDITPELLEAGVSVIDLSADYRIHDAKTYEQWYGAEHTSPELLRSAVYGLPELYRAELAELAKAHAEGEAVLVAVPGCYPTATALAATPALRAGLNATGTVISSAISGVSGAGRGANERTHFCHANENAEAYNVGKHRHTPEIEQTLTEQAGADMSVVFVPHLAPITRGLLATVYIELQHGTTPEQVAKVYEEAYEDEALVNLLPYGTMPQTSSVAGSARAQVGVAVDAHKAPMLVASCAIDNLGKGAATQAVQAANVALGFEETAGLMAPSPVV